MNAGGKCAGITAIRPLGSVGNGWSVKEIWLRYGSGNIDRGDNGSANHKNIKRFTTPGCAGDAAQTIIATRIVTILVILLRAFRSGRKNTRMTIILQIPVLRIHALAIVRHCRNSRAIGLPHLWRSHSQRHNSLLH